MQRPGRARPRTGAAAPRPMDLGPEIGGAQQSEDLYIFTVEHVTLKKGQRMVVQVAEFKLPYKDVYTLDIPSTPPPEVWQQIAPSSRSQRRPTSWPGPRPCTRCAWSTTANTR